MQHGHGHVEPLPKATDELGRQANFRYQHQRATPLSQNPFDEA
jgi:hypothetical protein